MSDETTKLDGPDFGNGVALSTVVDGAMLQGHSQGELAGSAAEESNPLRSAEFYREQGIDVKLRARVTKIDNASRDVRLEDGSRHGYDALLLATGAEPVHLDIPGADLPHVHYLRTLTDSR